MELEEQRIWEIFEVLNSSFGGEQAIKGEGLLWGGGGGGGGE